MAFVQSKSTSTDGTTSTTTAVTLTNNVALGNKLMGWLFFNNATDDFVSLADGLGNAFTIVDTRVDAGTGDVQKSFWADVTGAGACTVTLTTTAAHGFRGMVVHEVSNLVTGAPEQHTTALQLTPGTGTDAITTGNVTTVVVNQYIFGAVHVNNVIAMTVTQGTNYNDRESIDGTAAITPLESEDRIQSGAGAIAVTFTENSNQPATSCIMTFKQLSMAGATIGGTSAHPGRSPGYAPASFRFWSPTIVAPASVAATVVINEGVGAWTWLGVQSNLTKILTEGVGAWTWVGKTSTVPRLVAAVPGPYTWTGKTSPISKSIASLKGLYTWAGTSNTLARSLAPAPASYTWAGLHSTLGAPINETVGVWSWAGRQVTFVTLIQETIGRWTWAGTHSNVTVPGAASATHLYPIPGRRTRR